MWCWHTILQSELFTSGTNDCIERHDTNDRPVERDVRSRSCHELHGIDTIDIFICVEYFIYIILFCDQSFLNGHHDHHDHSSSVSDTVSVVSVTQSAVRRRGVTSVLAAPPPPQVVPRRQRPARRAARPRPSSRNRSRQSYEVTALGLVGLYTCCMPL